MIHQCRLHLSLTAADRAALEEAARLTPEQAAILNLLDRVIRIERRIGIGRGAAE